VRLDLCQDQISPCPLRLPEQPRQRKPQLFISISSDAVPPPAPEVSFLRRETETASQKE